MTSHHWIQCWLIVDWTFDTHLGKFESKWKRFLFTQKEKLRMHLKCHHCASQFCWIGTWRSWSIFYMNQSDCIHSKRYHKIESSCIIFWHFVDLCVEIYLASICLHRDHTANERWRYSVMPSLIGWAHTQNGPCYMYLLEAVRSYYHEHLIRKFEKSMPLTQYSNVRNVNSMWYIESGFQLCIES